MSGRRSKEIRKKKIAAGPMALGALVAYTALGTHGVAAQTPAAGTATGRDGRPAATLPLRSFDVPAGALEAALRTFEAQSGIHLTLALDASAVRDLTTAGVSGMLTNEEALRKLLDGTGLEARFRGRRAATIGLPSMGESIDVTSTTPTVSSPKFTEPLLDTPRTIAVIPEETFTEQGATTLRDVLRNTPGITFQAGEGGGGLPGDTFSMRGFSSGNDILLDGVREVGAYSRDAFNLEQVEVVKGPSSAIAGRGATGGSINLVTKSPKPQELTRVTAGAGSSSYSRFTADTNKPFDGIPGAAVRVNAMYAHAGVPGRDVVENTSWGIAPSLAFGIGRPSRFTLSYQHLQQNDVPDYGLPWAALEAGVDQSNFYGLEDYDYEDVSSDVATMTVDRDLFAGDSDGHWTLRNISRYGDNHRDSAITAPRPPNRQLQQRTMDNGQLANQTSLSGSLLMGEVRHDLVLGLELARETTDTRRQAQTTNQPQTTLDHPDPHELPFGPMPVNAGNPLETRLDLAGVYAFDTLSLGRRWEATGGIRFDAVDIDFEETNPAAGETTKLAKNESALSWNAGLVYKPRPSATLYASAATSFNPSVEAGNTGAALSDVPTAANNVNLDPEKSRNLELGGKLEFAHGRAVGTAALFRTEKTNARTRAANGEPFVQSGKQRVDGFEIGLTGNLSDRWSVLAAYSHLDAEFVESVNPAEEGAELAFTPEHSFNAWIHGRLPRGFSVGGGVQFMDAVFRNATNTAEAPSYWLASAMAAYDVTASLTMRLNVNNLLDESYVDRVGGGHYIPGARRSFVLTADFDF